MKLMFQHFYNSNTIQRSNECFFVIITTINLTMLHAIEILHFHSEYLCVFFTNHTVVNGCLRPYSILSNAIWNSCFSLFSLCRLLFAGKKIILEKAKDNIVHKFAILGFEAYLFSYRWQISCHVFLVQFSTFYATSYNGRSVKL